MGSLLIELTNSDQDRAESQLQKAKALAATVGGRVVTSGNRRIYGMQVECPGVTGEELERLWEGKDERDRG